MVAGLPESAGPLTTVVREGRTLVFPLSLQDTDSFSIRVQLDRGW